MLASDAVAQESLGTGQILLRGLVVDIDTRPDVEGLQTGMTAVKDIPTGVVTFVGLPGSALAPSIPAGALVRAQLSGPSFGAEVVPIAGAPNAGLALPIFAVPGTHEIRNVRLEDAAGNVLLVRDPALPTIAIEVIEKLLVTQVTSRELTLEEIREKGIVIDEDNFTALNFVVGLSLGSERVTIELPVIVPLTGAGLAELEPPRFPVLGTTAAALRKIDIPNFSLSGFRLRVPPEEEGIDRRLIPPIDGVIIIPGSIGFLNQFFSVIVQATNAGPDGSGLVVRGAHALIDLPKGEDEIRPSGDDPLRVAETQAGTFEDLPLVDAAGSDDISPQATHSAEFLVEGLREGTHPVRFDLGGELFVPALGRSVAVEGAAVGVVQVRNPTFSVVLAHPDVVRAGEEYSLFATVTNTSARIANLFRLELPARSLSGTSLAPGQEAVRTLETLLPGDSASFEFRMLSRTTGQVTGTAFVADEGVSGSFVITHGVGDAGIPLSPDTLVLPQTVDFLPDDPDLVFAAVRALGMAYSVATAPAGALPPEIARVSRDHVFERAVKLAQAGLHVQFGEDGFAATQDVLLDWLGNDLGRLDVLFPEDPEAQADESADTRAFDGLLRATDAGHDLGEVAGGVLAGALAQRSLAQIQTDMAELFASRPAHLSFGASARGSPVLIELRDDAGNRLGRADPQAEIAHELSFAARLPLASSATASDELLLVGHPAAPAYELAVFAPEGASSLSLSLVAPDGSGASTVTWPGIGLAPGGAVRGALSRTGPNAFLLEVDADGDGIAEQSLAPASIETVVDRAPVMLKVSQWAKGDRPSALPSLESGDPLGRMLGILFDEEVTRASAELAAAYAVPDNRVSQVALQPDRRLAFAFLELPVGPFVPRTLTASGILDMGGNALASATLPIVPDPERGEAGRVTGQVVAPDGTPIPFAQVTYIQPMFVPDLFCDVEDAIVSRLEADAQGRFALDFVLRNGHDRNCTPDIWLNQTSTGSTDNYKLEAEDPQSGELGRASTRIQFDGQHQDYRVILRGTGSIAGRVFDEAGNPLPGDPDEGSPARIAIIARNLSTGEARSALADADGRFEIAEIAVGNVALTAVRPSDGLTGVSTLNLASSGARAQADLVLFPPFRFGTVTGRVLEADGITPAASVPVQLAGQVLTEVSLSGSRTSQLGAIATGVTGPAGEFRFEHVPAGDIAVRAIRQATFEQADAASVLVGGGVADLLLALPGGGGTVRGIVRDALGNVVPFATVAGGPTLTQADAGGVFEIRGLPLGSFTVYGQGFDSPALGQVEVTTTGPDDLQEIVITLQPVGSIRGTVFEADGSTRRAGQKVQLWVEEDGGGGVIAEAFSDSAGNFAFDRYPVGRYSLRAIAPGSGTLDGGMTQSEIRFAGDVRDADVVFRGLGEIRGRVIQSNGTPVISDVIVTRKVWKIVVDIGPIDNAALGLAALQQFARVSELAEAVRASIVDNALDRPAPEFFLLVDEFDAVRSDELGPGGEVTGRFSFGPATGGPFTVAAFGPFLSPAEVRSEIPRSIDPAERIVDVGDIVLEPATSRVEGTVFLPDGVTPAGPDVLVRIRSLDPSGEISTSAGSESQVLPEYSVATDEDGHFVFPLVLRGGFSLTADTGVPDPALRADTPAEMQTEVAAARNVRLFGRTGGVAPRGGSVVADIRLEDVAGVRARVVDADGVTPVEGARVELVTQSGLDEDPAPAFTDAAGEVAFFPVPEGSFSLALRLTGDPRRAAATGSVPVDPPNGLELPVVLQLGAVTTASGQIVAAQRFGRVEGTVRRADLAPLPNPAQVVVSSAGVSILTTSGPDGRYAADNVPGGFVRVDVLEPLTARRGTASGVISADGQVLSLDVVLVGLGTVRGEVFSNDGSRELGGVDLELIPSGNFSQRLVSRTDPDGAYTLPGVPLGSYELRARDFGSGLSGSANGLVPRDGALVTTDVFLEPSGAIGGIVYGPGVRLDGAGNPVDASGAPFPGAPVAAGALVRISSDSFSQVVQADSQGRFVSNSFLRVGEYALRATALAGADGAAGSARIRFDGETVQAALALRGSGAVSGVVLDSAGSAPVSGASVTLGSESEFSLGPVTRITGADGRFEFPEVPVGRFGLTVQTNLQVPQLGGGAGGEIEAHQQVAVFEDGDADPLHSAIRLQPAGSIRANVRIDDGITPAEGAVVLVEGTSLRFSRLVDAAGDVVLDGIPLGSYAISILEPSSNGRAQAVILLDQNGAVFDLGDVVLDAGRPRFVAASPFSGQTGINPAGPIQITFSEPLDPESVMPESFRVSVGGVPVTGTYAASPGSPLVSFTPASRLPDLRRIDVELRGDRSGFDGVVQTPGLRDRAGNSLASDVRLSFTTGDSQPPQVSALSPADGAVEVEFASAVRIDFDEPVDPTSVASFALSTGGAPVAGPASSILGGRSLVITPVALLLPDRLYTARLIGPARDASGNAMPQAEIAWSFRTRDTLPPTVASLALAPGSALRQGGVIGVSPLLASGSEDTVSVEFTLNGALVATRGAAPFAVSIPIPAGTPAASVLGAIAVDEVGNRSPLATLPLSIASNAPPAVSLAGPADAVVSQGERVVLRVSATDDLALASLSFTATGAASASGSQPVPGLAAAEAEFFVDVPAGAASGSSLTLRGAATDSLGATAQSAPLVLAVADELAPAVTVISPAANSTVDAGATVNVNLRADDAGGVRELALEVSGAATMSELRSFTPPVTLATAAFSFAVPADAAGGAAISLRARATDASGRSGERVIALRVRDANPPAVSVVQQNGSVLFEPGKLLLLRVAASDDVGVVRVEVSVPGVPTQARNLTPAASTEQIFSFTAPAVALGQSLEVRAMALDTAANSTPSAPLVLVAADLTPPTVAITSPAAGALVERGAALDVSVQAADGFALASITCSASGALVASQTLAVEPPAALAARTCSFGVPADAAEGAAIELAVGALDASGNAAAVVSRSVSVRDATAPQVLAIDPPAGADDVPPSAGVSVTFSEPIDPATRSAFSLVGPQGAVSGSLALASGDAQLLFTPAVPLVGGASYTIGISTALRDRAGNALAAAVSSSFTVRDDFAGPCITALEPLDGASGVALVPVIRASFDELIDPASLVPGAARLIDVASGAPLAASLALEPDGRALRLTPAAPLAVDAAYRVEWTRALEDRSGNPARSAQECAGGADEPANALIAVQTFTTGVFRIASPADGTRVVEGQTLRLVAEASAGVGIRAAGFQVGGTFVSSTGLASPFSADVHVPALAQLGGNPLAVGLVGGAGANLALAPGTTAAASSSYSSSYLPPRAIDGDPNTSWFSQRPPAAEEYVEATLPADASAGAVRVLGNREFADGFDFFTGRVELFDAGGVLLHSSGAQLLPAPTRDLALATPALAGVRRVRFTGTSGDPLDRGIAELEVYAPTSGSGIGLIVEPAGADSDGDGLVNADELALGTDPFSTDTDGDGLADGAEQAAGTDPLDPDSDGDGIPDGEDVASGPRLLALDPPDGAIGASLAPLVSARFDEPLDPASVGPDSLRLLQAGSVVPAALALSADGRALELRPAAPLALDALVTAELSGTLRDAQGNPARDLAGQPFGTLVWSFRTTSFGITQPAGGSQVIESSTLSIRASGSAALGIGSVEFLIDAAPLSTDAGAPFEASFEVPAASELAGFEITAIARAAGGAELARDTVAVSVAPALRLDSRLVGVPLGGSADLVLRVPSPLAVPLEIELETGDATRVGLPGPAATLPAGALELRVPLAGLAEGNAGVTARIPGVELFAVASVSALAPGQDLFAEAAPTGIAVRSFPYLGQVVLAPGTTRSFSLRLLAAPAQASTPVSVTSSDPAVVTAAQGASIPAGSSDVTLLLTAGSAGRAALGLRAGGVGGELAVVVGAPAAGSTPPVLAPPVGITVRGFESAGHVIAAPAGTRTITLKLLDAPAAADTPVVASSSNPAVAAVIGTPVVRAGSTDAEIELQTGAAGDALLLLRAGDQGRELRVIVGAPTPELTPPVLAPTVGLTVGGLSSVGQIALAPGATRSLELRLLDAPAAADTPVTATSSNPAVAILLGGAQVAAGSADAQLTLASGTAGDAVLVLRAGSVVRELRVVVDAAPAANRSVPVGAAPVGITVRSLPSAGQLTLDPGATRSITLRLLGAPAAAAVPVQATSSNPAVAVLAGPADIPAGSTDASLSIAAGQAGEAVLDLRAGEVALELRVVVSATPGPGQSPPVLAPPVGVRVESQP